MSLPLPPVVNLQLPAVKPAHEALADVIRTNIVTGTFAIGMRLPTERDLAPSLGVSRNTARQAIKILVDEGLVETTLGRNGGSIVSEPAAPARSRKAVLAKWRSSFENSYQLRLAIEPLAARWAAEQGTAGERRAILKLGSTPSSDMSELDRLEWSWHQLVAHASHSAVVSQAVVGCRIELFDGIGPMWVRSALKADLRPPEFKVPDFAVEHGPMSAAINDRDGDGAEQAMRAHLENSIARFETLADLVLAG